MPIDDRYVPRGWLHISTRFSLLHPLKMRYFVLLDKELRYYKHPDDTHAAGVIELKDFQGIEEHNASDLFGFKLVSETSKGHWIPMLYAETKEERCLWMKRIKANLNRLSKCSHHCSPYFCVLDSHHHGNKDDSVHGHHALSSVLGRWLNKLDLYDGSDDDLDYFTRQSSPSSSPNHSRSDSTVFGHSSSSSVKHRSTESIHTSEFNSSSLYSEPATMTSDSNASSFSSGHHYNKRQYSTPIKYHPMSQHRQASQNSSSVTHRANTYNSPVLISNAAYFLQSASSHQITKLMSIESERLKYAETTLQYYQHPHIHRSTSTKFSSELGISLSPPPPRR
ncbi:hypothetical protein MAM1_0158d06864 [Mucor ambiguus]|uniref:PH domain-containing protein n=1 Tax=Mucor ambiguus TaxID=91626 RepID=A0A0C9MV71_9FUNG|nr:hypothetical protein MAM1_0158d06864 [Mucor ambiguus]